MKIGSRILILVSALVLTLTLAGGVWAHETSSQHILAQRLAQRFNLNENEVKSFLDQYYHEDNSGDRRDNGTFNNRSDRLDFIERKLNKGVNDGWITASQKSAAVAKIKQMMDSGPSEGSYNQMSESEKKERINTWQKEMRPWARSNGFTLDQIKNLTGKGNKYLMGME